MKKYIIFLITLLSVSSLTLTAGSSWISQAIPDNAALREGLSDYLNKTPGSITEQDLLNINDLDLKDKGLKSLDGIELLIGLEILDVSNNQIKDIEPLKLLPSLTTIYLNDNYINMTSFIQLAIINDLTEKGIYIELGNQIYTPVKETSHLFGDGTSRFEIMYDEDGSRHFRIGGKPFSEVALNIKEDIKNSAKELSKKTVEGTKNLAENTKKTYHKAKDKVKKWKKKW